MRPGVAPHVHPAQVVVVNPVAEHGLDGALPAPAQALAPAALLARPRPAIPCAYPNFEGIVGTAWSDRPRRSDRLTWTRNRWYDYRSDRLERPDRSDGLYLGIARRPSGGFWGAGS